MTDQEKVMSWIEGLAQDDWRQFHSDSEVSNIAKAALTLLKEQKAKAGTWQWKIHGKPESGGTIGEAICDQCGESTFATAVKGELNYCPNCGAKMKKLSAIK